LHRDNPIGIFDSGIGGLTVAHAINKVLPNEKLIYFGDIQHLPYGNKSSNKILNYSEKIVDFLIKKKCKAIIIACNSASAISYKLLKKKVSSKCLLFNVIDPVVKEVINNKSIKNIGVIGTLATIKTDIYKTSIEKKRSDVNVFSLATPLLASLIEEDDNQLYKKGIIESYLSHKNLKNIDSLILGCTHYPMIQSKIATHYKKKIIILNTLKYIGYEVYMKLKTKNLLNSNNHNSPKHNFYVSDYTENFQKKTQLFFPTEIILKEVNIFS
tara:strand:- start:37943 stop:38752 length:810 start_codon:yes stop_codon:yes gene_type:complete